MVAFDVVAHRARGDTEVGRGLAVGEGVVFNPRAQLRGTVGEGFAVIDEVGIEARATHFGAQLGDLASDGVEALGEAFEGIDEDGGGRFARW